MIIPLTTDDLQAIYDLAWAKYGNRLRAVIERRLRSATFPIIIHGPEGRPEAKPATTGDGLVSMTQKTWSKFLQRKVSEQEASTIIASFTNLADLMREVKRAKAH